MHGYDKGEKVSRYDNLKQVEKSLRRKPKQLQGLIEINEDVRYIWDLFIDLFSSTGGEISYSEIKAYSELIADVSPFEIRCIMALKRMRKERQ